MGEALNILAPTNPAGMSKGSALHHYLEASALAFADRGKYVGDPPRWTSPPLPSPIRSSARSGHA